MRAAIFVSVAALTLTLGIDAQQPPVPAVTAEAKPDSLCSLEGKVVNANTGEALSKAVITMRPAEQVRQAMGPPQTFSTTTGADGRFAMKDIEPGSYRLTVMRNGFVQSEYGSRGPMRSGTTLKLEAGQKLSSIDFKMSPHGVISGRVVDQDGEPVAWVQVSPMRYVFRQGRKQLTPHGGASTNDLGEFRIFGLAPGRYMLSANYTQRMTWEGAQDRSAAGTSDDSYVPVYYPGSTDPASASMLEVGAGQHVSGIEMKLTKTKTVRLRGRVQNMTEASMQPMMVSIDPRNSFMYFMSNRTTMRDPRGNFEFRGLAPGSYTVTAMVMDGQSRYITRKEVEIGSEHIDNFVLQLTPGMQLQGHLQVEGPSAATFDLGAVRIGLGPVADGVMMYGGPMTERPQADGSFRLLNVGADRYRVRVANLPDGYYVRAVRIGDQLAVDNAVDLTAGGGGTLHVTLAEGAAQVSGTVTNDKQEPFVGATVVLLPEKEELRAVWEYVKIATTNQNGTYSMKNIDPGDYRLFAWEDIENGSWADPDVIKPVESKGKKLALRPSASETIELRAIRNE